MPTQFVEIRGIYIDAQDGQDWIDTIPFILFIHANCFLAAVIVTIGCDMRQGCSPPALC